MRSDPDNKVYRHGEKARLELRAERDARVGVFNIMANDRVVMLFPDSLDRANELPTGKTFIFPADGSKAELVIQTLPGHPRDAEAFLAVAVGKGERGDFVKTFPLGTSHSLAGFFERVAEIAPIPRR